MTSGNDPYVEHLRGRLTAVLDDITTPAAPTTAVKRKGKAIRNRRRIGVAAGLAVAVVAAGLVPGLLHQSKASRPISPQHKNPKVTVGTVGPGAPKGLIARGAIDGKRWRISLTWQDKELCVRTSGNLPQSGCGYSGSYAAAWPATLDATGGGGINALYGKVSGQVKRVSVELSDGAVLNLRPVRFGGHQWIAVELPAKLAVTMATAFSGRGELAYAIPFTAVPGGLPSFRAWLRPGEPAPREFARLIGSGVSAGRRWSVTLHVGPWGKCVVAAIPGDSGNTGCWSDSSRQPGLIMGSGGPVDPPSWFIGVARPQTSYLVLTMTDGSKRRVRVVQVGNLPFYAIVMLDGPRIARWAAYDASGHRLDGGNGAPSFEH